jgi:hypothetical protein
MGILTGCKPMETRCTQGLKWGCLTCSNLRVILFSSWAGLVNGNKDGEINEVNEGMKNKL